MRKATNDNNTNTDWPTKYHNVLWKYLQNKIIRKRTTFRWC